MRGFKKQTLLTSTLLALCLLSGCTKNFADTPFNSDDKKVSGIINGKFVTDDSVLSKTTVLLANPVVGEICTATLLGGNYALTAAHCLDQEKPENMYVFFGTQPNGNSERRQVVAMKASPYWELRRREAKNTGDIAIIKFDGGPLPKGYVAAELLENSNLLKNGLNATVLGYGITEANIDEGEGILRMAILPILDKDFSSTEITLDQSKGSSVCHGDSGGPAYVYIPPTKKTTGHYALWGISNRGLNDNDNDCQGSVAYTNVLIYLVWIQNVLRTL